MSQSVHRDALGIGRDHRFTLLVCTVLNRFFTSPITSAAMLPWMLEAARVAEVHVLARRQRQRVARHTVRAIAARAVVIQLEVAAHVDRNAARELQRDAEHVVVEDGARGAVTLELRRCHDAADEGVALVEDVGPAIAIEVGRVDAATDITLHRQGAGDGRVIFAITKGIGEVEADAWTAAVT